MALIVHLEPFLNATWGEGTECGAYTRYSLVPNRTDGFGTYGMQVRAKSK
jgi:hypothetical protein